jgi:hypothetical protein
MKNIVGACLPALALLFPCIAAADGNDLLSKCPAAVNLMDNRSETDDYLGLGYCLGMMQGMTNLNKVYELRLGEKALFCTPESGIKNGQAARIVVKYLMEHPETLHENESFLAVSALKEAYPCQ